MWLHRESPPSSFGRIPRGVAGTRATLELMRRLADEGARDVNVRQKAIEILQASGVQPHDFAGELRALFLWVRDHVRFTRDPVNLETLQTPARTLAWGAGDCDDMSTLLAALARTVGIPAQLAFRAIGSNRRSPGSFNHVYVVARMGGRELAMDPIYPGTPFGWQYPNPTVREDLPLWAT